MIIEAASDLDPNLLRADICVVGAGAAGIALAREFIGSPVRVCVLESGGLEFDREVQSLCEGEIVGLDYFPLDTTRLRYFGGTTNHWGGLCRPLDPIDFEVRPWVPGSGWPIGPADLEIFNQRAHEVCEIRSSRYDPEWLEERLGASLLGLDPSNFVSTVMRYSPPTRFGTTYRPELAMAENVTVILYANVLRFEANEAADAVQSVCLVSGTGRRSSWKRRPMYLLPEGSRIRGSSCCLIRCRSRGWAISTTSSGATSWSIPIMISG